MGKNWSVVVVPGERNELVTNGLYRFVRHPIYALSVVVMASTAIIVPVWPMIAAVIVHTGLMIYKASSEERFLVDLHGREYLNYRNRTGRFLPRLVAGSEVREYRNAA
jgi:protein-S-isoprenylcysteine O-methyltransferase Ste14